MPILGTWGNPFSGTNKQDSAIEPPKYDAFPTGNKLSPDEKCLFDTINECCSQSRAAVILAHSKRLKTKDVQKGFYSTIGAAHYSLRFLLRKQVDQDQNSGAL